MQIKPAYSIVQYFPDPDRQEGINVGIVLFDEVSGRARTKFSESFSKLKFEGSAISANFIRLALRELDKRISRELRSESSRDAITSFAKMRANNIRLTPFLPTFSNDLEKEIDRLFASLVGQPKLDQRGQRVATKMKSSLEKLGVLNQFDQKPERVALPRYQVVIKPDLGLRKAVYHLIEASNFRTPEEGFESAGKHALEGRALYNNLGMRLVVVGDFSEQPVDYFQTIKSDLEYAETKLYRVEQMADLARDLVYH